VHSTRLFLRAFTEQKGKKIPGEEVIQMRWSTTTLSGKINSQIDERERLA
jgi:hypothetical protein